MTTFKRTVMIGSKAYDVFDAKPDDWSMENDYIRDIKQLSEGGSVQLFRITSWMGRVLYVLERLGKILELPLKPALEISRLIENAESVTTGES